MKRGASNRHRELLPLVSDKWFLREYAKGMEKEKVGGIRGSDMGRWQRLHPEGERMHLPARFKARTLVRVQPSPSSSGMGGTQPWK